MSKIHIRAVNIGLVILALTIALVSLVLARQKSEVSSDSKHPNRKVIDDRDDFLSHIDAFKRDICGSYSEQNHDRKIVHKSAHKINGTKRMFKANPVDVEDYPSFVHIINNRKKTRCGGVIIHDNAVITAKNCFDKDTDEITIFAGFPFKGEPQMFRIKRSCGYSKKDIGIIIIDGTFQYDDCVQPACLNLNDNSMYRSKNFYMVAAGTTSKNWIYNEDDTIYETTVRHDRASRCRQHREIWCFSNGGKQIGHGNTGSPTYYIRRGKMYYVGPILSYNRKFRCDCMEEDDDESDISLSLVISELSDDFGDFINECIPPSNH